MTDAAVIADPGPAPDAAPGGAVVNENAPSHSEPVGSQAPEPRAAEPAKPVSLDAALDNAMAKAEAKAKPAEKPAAKPEAKVDAKPEAKPEPKAAPERGEGGKFVAKDAPQADPAKPDEAAKPSHTADDAPARFTDTAKAKWHAADPEIRGETLRMHKELTEGFQKYKQAAERDQSIAEFHEMAQKGGTTVKDALSRYVGIENKLRSDLLGGLEEVISNASQGKLSLRDVAAHIMGQKPEEQASQQDTVIRELKNELATLKQQVGGVTQTIEQQREHATLTEINKFAADNPRFEELAEDISFFLKSGRAKDLPEAYQLAERLNPAPQAKDDPPAASSVATQDPPPAQPDKGGKSINGAPSPGSTPAAKKRVAKPLDEALNTAFARLG